MNETNKKNVIFQDGFPKTKAKNHAHTHAQVHVHAYPSVQVH